MRFRQVIHHLADRGPLFIRFLAAGRLGLLPSFLTGSRLVNQMLYAGCCPKVIPDLMSGHCSQPGGRTADIGGRVVDGLNERQDGITDDILRQMLVALDSKKNEPPD